MYAFARALHTMRMARVRPRFKSHRKNFIREWREYRNLTLVVLAERVGAKIGGFTHASLSRIERGLQPYSQPVLEAIADALLCEPVDLLVRNPNDPGIWSIWEQAKPGERRQILEIAKTLIRTGS